MRKSKVWQIMAAAVAATPATFAFAEDVGLTPNEVRESPRQSVDSDIPTAGAGRFRFATPVGTSGPDADVDGAFLGGVFSPGDAVSWQNPANWTTNPQIPDGAAAIARFDGRANGASVTLGNTNVTVSQLFLKDPQLTAIVGGTLTLAGPATVHSDATFFNPPSVVFGSINALGTATTSLHIAGNAGFTKTGAGFASIGNNASFTGPVNINGGNLAVNADDASLGNPANVLNINGGTLDVRTTALNTSRTINVGANGASIYWAGGAAVLFTSAGDITGTSTLTLNGGFGVGVGPATFTTAKSFSGAVRLTGGTLNLASGGAIANASSVLSRGTLALRDSGVNRIGDTTTVTLDGAALTANNVGNEVKGNHTL